MQTSQFPSPDGLSPDDPSLVIQLVRRLNTEEAHSEAFNMAKAPLERADVESWCSDEFDGSRRAEAAADALKIADQTKRAELMEAFETTDRTIQEKVAEKISYEQERLPVAAIGYFRRDSFESRTASALLPQPKGCAETSSTQTASQINSSSAWTSLAPYENLTPDTIVDAWLKMGILPYLPPPE